MVIEIKFEISDVDALSRIGKIEINGKKMKTPNLFPVIHPFENIITPDQLQKQGVECLFTNAFIIYQNADLRERVIKEGIHRYLDYDGIIATDSGAFQQYMYTNEIEINPERIERFQETIGSDFPVILDIPVQFEDDYLLAREKINTNINRAKQNIARRINKGSNWIGPIHGGLYKGLLRKSAKIMSDLDFAIFAIGGLVKPFLDYRFDVTINILLNVKKHIKPNKPLHMFGLGLPQFFSLAVACGCDLMDSAAYILYAKEDRYFTLSTGTRKLDELHEFPCCCPICLKYTPNEIKKFEPKFKIKLIAQHNLNVSLSELKTIRQAIKEGNLLELVESRIRNHPNLVDAYNVVRNHLKYFEIYEKAFKTHGRLFSSIESAYSPIIYRYTKKILFQYRSPPGVRFLILLPEINSGIRNSPEINKWLTEINKNKLVDSELIEIMFVSPLFGLIPSELCDIYPLTQHERYKMNKFSPIALNLINQFIKRNISDYDLVGVLHPESYINQFNEKVRFTEDFLMSYLTKYLNGINDSKIIRFNRIKSILMYFKSWVDR